MSFPNQILRRCGSLSVALLMVLLAVLGSPEPASADDRAVKETTAMARDFFQAFVAKDMKRVGSFFAPGARVQRSRLGEAAPEIVTFDAPAWVAEAGESIAPVEDFKVEILETSGLGFGDGATVSVRFQATGAVGGGRFTNDGVDSLSFTRVGGDWKIVLYNSFEKLVFSAPAPAAQP